MTEHEDPSEQIKLPTPEEFVGITTKVSDARFTYMQADIGEDKIVQDADELRIASDAVKALDEREWEAYTDEQIRLAADEKFDPLNTSDYSGMHFDDLLSDKVGRVGIYTLTYATSGELFLEGRNATPEDPVGLIKVRVVLTQAGKLEITKRRLTLPENEEATLNDIAAINHILETLKKMPQIFPEKKK